MHKSLRISLFILLYLCKWNIVFCQPTAALRADVSTICAGGSVNLSVTFTGTAPWNFTYSDGRNSFSYNTINQNPFTFTVQPTISTTYSLLSVTDQNQNGSANGSVSINVLPLPTVSFTGLNDSYCIGNITVLQGSPSGGVFSGNGVGGNNFTASIPGTYPVTYTYSDQNGCTNSVSKNVTVFSIPVISISGLNSTYCQSNVPVTISVSPSGGTFYGLGINGNTYTPSTVGSNQITYTYTDGNGCFNSFSKSVNVNALPAVDISGLNAAFCQNDAVVQLTGSPSGGAFSGTGMNGNVFNPSNLGVNSITYSYTDSKGCTNSLTKSTIVNSRPTSPTLTGGFRCGPGQVQLSASGASGDIKYRWYELHYDGVVLAELTSNIFTTPSLTESKTYYSSMINSVTGCESERVAVSAIVKTLPASPTVTSSVSICEMAPFTITASNGTNNNYLWYDVATGGSPIDSDASLNSNGINATQTYYVETRDNDCASNRSPVVVNVIPAPASPVGSSTPYCSYTTYSATGGAQDDVYLWYQFESSNSNPIYVGQTFNVSLPNTYLTDVFYVWTQNTRGCKSLQHASISGTFYQIPSPPTSKVDQTVCGPGYVTLTASGAAAGNSYQWFNQSTGGTALYQNVKGSYTVYISGTTTFYVGTINSQGCQSTSRIPVTAYVNAISYQSPLNRTVCINGTTKFSITADGEGIVYQWQVSKNAGVSFVKVIDGACYSGSGTTELTIIGATLAMNNYQYRCYLTNPCDQKTTMAALLKINSACILRNGVEDDILEGTQAFPNPFENKINISFDGSDENVSVVITDPEGKTIFSKENHPSDQMLILGEEFKDGLYFVKIKSKENTQTIKIVKAH